MPVESVVDQTSLIRRWHELAADPDAPDYYEVNEYGEIITTPRPTSDHQRVVTAVASALTEQLRREAVQEISVLTDRGIRVPDVVWMEPGRWATAKGKIPLPFVPDICVEVLSRGNTKEEVPMKVNAYLRGGAREVLVVGLRGEVEIFGAEGRRSASALGINLRLPVSLF